MKMTNDQAPMTNGRYWAWPALVLWSLVLGHWSFAAEPPPPVLQAQQERVETIQRAVKTAVCIFAKEGSGGGSGVVISADGYALTNFHVVQPAGIGNSAAWPTANCTTPWSLASIPSATWR
jgi:S1-C subfamily serine protease